MKREKNHAEQAIEQLKNALGDLLEGNPDLQENLYLLRWLKARKMNVEKAEKMVRQAMRWRKEFKVHELVNQDFHPGIHVEFPIYQGKLRDGTPVLMVNVGKIDIDGCIRKFGKDEMHKFTMQHAAKGERDNLAHRTQQFYSQGLDNPEIGEDSFPGIAFLFDLKGLAYKQVISPRNISLAIRMAWDYIHNFHGLAHLGILVNCPKLSLRVINFLKRIIESPDLTIEIYGTNEAEWQEAVFKRLNPQETPTIFGGQKVVSELL